MALNIDRDHWAFLDEIEAPMWVDLTVVARGNYQDLEDGWFRTSHTYHQCPSLELKAAFAYSGEDSASSGIDLNGQSSPKLPSSVSGSRGKHNRSKREKEVDYVFPWNKRHPVKVLSGKSSWNSGSGEEIKPKVSFINSKGTWRSKNVVRDLTGNAKQNNSKAISSHGDSEGSVSCMEDKAVDSNTSTLTSENDQKIQPKNPELSSQAFGQSNGLLSALRTNLRKSCVTRQASRVYVSKRKQSRDSNPISGNSSVGSSSKPGYINKNSIFPLKQQREQTADSRKETRTSRVIRSKERESALSKVLSIQVKEGIRNSRTGRISNGPKPANHDATKPKVQSQIVRAKALTTRRVNEQRSSPHAEKAQEKVGHNRLVSAGTENKTAGVPVSQKGNGGYITTGVMTRGQKGTKQDALWKGNRTRLAGPKEKVSSPRSRGKHPTITTQRIYLR